MLTKSNVFEISRHGYALMHGDKWNVSRSLRRFLKEAIGAATSSASRMLLVSYAYEEGHSKEQLSAIERYAALREEHAQQYLTEGGVTFHRVHRDDDYSTVFSEFELAWNPSTASLKELQLMARAVVVLSDCMHEFVAEPNRTALVGCPMYVYRGAPCSIADDESLWCVSGSDKKDGSAGVLEWCYDKEDALERLQMMSRFPERFIGLRASSFLESMQPVPA